MDFIRNIIDTNEKDVIFFNKEFANDPVDRSLVFERSSKVFKMALYLSNTTSITL